MIHTQFRRSRRGWAASLIVAGCVLTLVGSGLSAARALAVYQDITETGAPGMLGLAVSSNTPLQVTLAPGDTAKWLVRATLSDAPEGDLAIEVDANGALLDSANIMARVDACTGHFDSTNIDLPADRIACSADRSMIIAPTRLSELVSLGQRYELLRIDRNDPRELLVVLSVPGTADSHAMAGEVANIGLGVHAKGEGSTEEPPKQDPSNLAVTGTDMLSLGTLAVGMIGMLLGLVLFQVSRRNAEAGESVADA